MNDRLHELYRGVAVHANADLEHTAALELLALVMAADRNLEQAEIDAIKDISDDWRDGDFTFDKYLGPAIVRAQDAITKDEVVELIDDIDRQISSRVLRRALFSAAREVVGIDDAGTPEGVPSSGVTASSMPTTSRAAENSARRSTLLLIWRSMSSISSTTSSFVIASWARTIAGPRYLSKVKSPSRQSSEMSLIASISACSRLRSAAMTSARSSSAAVCSRSAFAWTATPR